MKVTLKQIADIAGVSRGTIDRVLHDRGGVNPQVQMHVLEVCEKLGYKPNVIGRQLAACRSEIKFGIVLPEQSGFWGVVGEGIQSATRELESFSIKVLIREYVMRKDREVIACIDSLLSEGISGLIIAPTNGLDMQKKLNEVIEMGIPVVLVNTEIENVQPLCYIGIDYGVNGSTAAGLMNLIADQRPMKLIIFTGSPNVLAHTRRVTSFLQELNRLNTPYDLVDTCTIYTSDDISSGAESYQRCCNMLRRHPETTAVFTAAGSVEASAMAIKDMGMIGRIRHIGFDLLPSSHPFLQDGSLTAVISQEAFRQGELPLQVLFNYVVNKIPPERERILLNNEIFIRQNAAMEAFQADENKK